MARWSSGQDGGLSRRKQEFDSPTGHHFSSHNSIVGVDYGEGPPVPISNTVVKLAGADNTWLETAREDKLTPTQKAASESLRLFRSYKDIIPTARRRSA